MDDESVISKFGNYNANLTLEKDQEIIQKIQEICTTKGLSLDTLAAEYEAFAASNNNAPLTIDLVGKIASRIIGKKSTATVTPSTSGRLGRNTIPGYPSSRVQQIPNYNTTPTNLTKDFLAAQSNSSTSAISPISSKTIIKHEEEQEEAKEKEKGEKRNENEDYQASSSDRPMKMMKTSNEMMMAQKLQNIPPRVEIEVLENAESTFSSWRYLNTDIKTRADYLADQIKEFRSRLLKDKVVEKAYLKMEEDGLIPRRDPGVKFRAKFHIVGEPSLTPVVIAGRICCETHSGRMNPKSMQLEGPNGHRVALDLEKLREDYTFFPGQIVAFQGTCPTGRVFIVEKIIRSEPLKVQKTQASKLLEYHHNSTNSMAGEKLSIMIACGPYHPNNNVNLDTFETLMAQAKRDNPDLFILLGPFVDSRNLMVSSGVISEQVKDAQGMKTVTYLTFEDVFKLLCVRIKSLMIECPSMRILFVPSPNDITHSHVMYPQPQMTLPPKAFPESLKKRITCLPNPAVFRANEMVIGISNIDIIAALNGEDVRSPNVVKFQSQRPSGRLLGLADILIQERNYYPLFPGPENSLVDVTEMSRTEMKQEIGRVDILITPSKLQAFSGEVAMGGFADEEVPTLCVNPGFVASGKKTYAKLDVYPINKKTLEEYDPELLRPHGVFQRTKASIEELSTASNQS